ncbi:uncharacterized HTH-type transcriptional regulator HI_0186 [Arthrobacter sp. Hiyo6]|nr:uncharacterized HTH-type transcriptional regulator HI_0186 [Arthrobacter sp. Hiyo6]
MTPNDPSEVSIAEAAELTGVGVHTLRYYEGQQLLDVPRTASGRRRYGPRELAAVRFIAQLRKTGMPINVTREYAAMVRNRTSTSESRLRLLEAHRSARGGQSGRTAGIPARDQRENRRLPGATA